jgi:hypothetical protein
MIPHPSVHLVLRHDNVLGREGQEIHANVTQIDLHDFSRLAMTFDLGGFHAVTQIESQHRICGEILDYWRDGPGKTYNPHRVKALDKLHIHRDFEACLQKIVSQTGKEPILIATSAKPHDKNIDFADLPSIIGDSGRSVVVQFGTAWGLSPEQMNRCDGVLPPICGQHGYNHLSVRCAAAIIVDRLFR